MAQYKVGTISVTNGSAVITGSGTDWNNVLYNIKANDSVFIAGDTVDYRVLTVDSATQITLTGAVQRATGSGLTYAISKDFTPNISLPLVGTGDIRTDQLFSRAMNNLDSVVGGGTFSPTFNDLTVNGSLTVDTDLLYADSTNNRVGIGTTNPSYDLDVVGTARFSNASGSGHVRIVSSTTGTSSVYLGNIAANAVGRIEYNNAINGMLFVANNITSLFINGSGSVGIGTTVPTEALDVNSDAIRVRTSQTPASASATGNVGTICWDGNYIYVCTATNTWKRAALTTW